MAETIGRFEILGEIAHSDSAHVYKASDPESGQTVALKVLHANLPPEETAALVQRVLEEAESTKVLSSHNIAVLYGAGEIDGKFCAATEYLQGKSIAGMLTQHDSFSIWDLLDVARQSCQALDHAHTRKVVHYTLEPAKVVVTWDGTVKILGFGISTMGAGAAQASGKVPETLRYMSPEQVQGQALDGRSNLFTLGAILYEMVTDRKAFGGDNAEQVRQEITVGMPVPPAQIIPKIQPQLSELIMKALSKSPDQRYQSGQELLNDLENCKENKQKAAPRKMPKTVARNVEEDAVAEEPRFTVKKAAAAAAGADAGTSTARIDAVAGSSAKMSATVASPETEPETVTETPQPDRSASKRRSFSEIDSLPPLKEVYVAPPPPPEAEPEVASQEAERLPTLFAGLTNTQEEKVKTPPGEIAKKALAELRKTPPKLFLYSLGGAACVILLVLGVIFSRIHSENPEEGAAAAQASSTAAEATSMPAQTAPVEIQASPVPMEGSGQTAAGPDVISVKPKRGKPKAVKAVPPPAPVIIPGQLAVSSTPEGAQVLVDGHHNPAWLTPFDLTGLAPGQHLVSVSKPGYSTENRTIEVAAASKSFLVIQLAALGATALISSVPPGAEVFMDGRDTGHGTPAQIQVEKLGTHIFTVRKSGYLEETTTVTLQAGQSIQYAPVLRALGVTDDIKLGGKFKKIFGGGDTAGTGAVSVKTQPKGAQVSVNRRVLDKNSPVDFYLNPGNYIIDITLTGYKNVQRVINVDRGGKVTVDEVLERQ